MQMIPVAGEEYTPELTIEVTDMLSIMLLIANRDVSLSISGIIGMLIH